MSKGINTFNDIDNDTVNNAINNTISDTFNDTASDTVNDTYQTASGKRKTTGDGSVITCILKYLTDNGRTSEINRLAADPDFLTQILKEMGS
jgi:hypothetical protein